MEEVKMEIPEVEVQLVRSRMVHGVEILNSEKAVFEFFQRKADLMEKEYVYVVCVRTDMSLINYSLISIGGLDQALVDVKAVLKVALLSCASRILLVHTHPSGSIRPSKQDVCITDKLSRACSLCDICLVDHLIIGRENPECYSFAEKGKIKFSSLGFLETDFEKLNIRKVAAEEIRYY